MYQWSLSAQVSKHLTIFILSKSPTTNITVPFLQLNELQYTVVKVPIIDISTDAVTINCTCNLQSKMIDTFMIHTFYEDFFFFTSCGYNSTCQEMGKMLVLW